MAIKFLLEPESPSAQEEKEHRRVVESLLESILTRLSQIEQHLELVTEEELCSLELEDDLP